MRLLAILLLPFVVGCSTSRSITITTRPPGAAIDVDGIRQGRSPIVVSMSWDGPTDVRAVTANMSGYKEQTYPARSDTTRDTVDMVLKPISKKLTVKVEPVGAIVSINNVPLNTEPTMEVFAGEREFPRDPQTGAWKKYTITAERRGYKTATATATWEDNQFTYSLTLKPMEKEFSVITNPPGAQVFFDKEPIGTSPTEKISRQFAYDLKSESYLPHSISARLAGYPDQTIPDVSPEDGKSDYEINLQPSNKTIHIRTTPPGGIVTLEEKTYRPDANGDTTVPLTFPPTDEKGELKIYTGEIRKPRSANMEWKPLPITIRWDGGQKDYLFALREVRVMPLPLLTVSITHNASSWEIAPKVEETVAGRDIIEPGGAQVQPLTPPEVKGQNIDSLAISPDGKHLLFSLLIEKPQLHSLMYTMRADGFEPPLLLDDGKSLDVTPAFTADGDQIVYSSDRSGGRMMICSMPASGTGAIQQFMSQTIDLSPSMDSSPKTRVFYQAFSDRLTKPSIFSRAVDVNIWNDLQLEGGMQPRINPQNDALLYCALNERTEKRDLFSVSDRGGISTNLTNTPDADDYDASWDRVGARIAFASDQGVDDDKRHNADIWILDLSKPDAKPQRLTSNASHDDHPVWDPSGHYIYFRSNRGGQWGIWRIAVK